MTSVVTAWAVAFFVSASLHPAMPGLFTPMELHYTGGKYEKQLFKYRLFVPKPKEPGKKYPLLVWLHGHGERGADNERQMFHMQHLFRDPDDPSKYPFYVLAPQEPMEGGWFSGHKSPSEKGKTTKGDEMLTVVMEMLDKTITDCPIDVDRVYLLGISSGGCAAWELATRYPDRFAAVAPIASGGADLEDVVRLRDVPVWAFHCEFDELASIDGDRDTIEALREAGGSCYLTSLPGNSHDAWTGALRDNRVVSWMLRQRRGEPVKTPPDEWPWKVWLAWETKKPWTTGDIVYRAGIPLLLMVVLGSAWRQRRRRRRLARRRVEEAGETSGELVTNGEAGTEEES